MPRCSVFLPLHFSLRYPIFFDHSFGHFALIDESSKGFLFWQVMPRCSVLWLLQFLTRYSDSFEDLSFFRLLYCYVNRNFSACYALYRTYLVHLKTFPLSGFRFSCRYLDRGLPHYTCFDHPRAFHRGRSCHDVRSSGLDILIYLDISW